jgi:pilus assembly protein CpaB
MKQRKGCIWLIIGLLLALLAGGLAFVTMMRVTTATSAGPEAPKTTVVVATRAVNKGTVLKDLDVGLKEISTDAVPNGALASIDDAVDKVSTIDLVPGEVLLSNRLVDPSKVTSQIAFVVPEGKVVMAFPIADLMGSLNLLQAGDTVDILFSLKMKMKAGEGEQEYLETFDALQNTQITAIVMPPVPTTGKEETSSASQGPTGSPQALLIALDPQDALVLKHLKDADGIVDIVLRAPSDSQLFDTGPVDVQYLLDQYGIEEPGAR